MSKNIETAATVETVETSNPALVAEVRNAVGKSVAIERALVVKLAHAMTRKTNPVSVKSVALSIAEGTESAQLGELRPSMATYLVQVAELMAKEGSENLGIAALVALVRDLRALANEKLDSADGKATKADKLQAVSNTIEKSESVPALRAKVPSTVSKPRGKSGASQQGKRSDIENAKVNQKNLTSEVMELAERLAALRANTKTVSEGLRAALDTLSDELGAWFEI